MLVVHLLLFHETYFSPGLQLTSIKLIFRMQSAVVSSSKLLEHFFTASSGFTMCFCGIVFTSISCQESLFKYYLT